VTEVQIRKLPRQVAAVLGRRIVSSAAAGLDVPLLTEHEICGEFSVSRSVAREALGILATLDMITISQGKRVTLRPVAEWDYLSPVMLEMLAPEEVHRLLGELHEVRLLLEPQIAARAAERISPEGLARLRAALDSMAAREMEPDAYLEEDLRFHTELCWAHQNRVLERMVYSCRWLLVASRQVTSAAPQPVQAVTEAHRQIYLAVEAGDPDAAHDAMVSHLETVTPVWLGGPGSEQVRDSPQKAADGQTRKG
jgi:GntR family galactonate operon transcriptional repressor